MSAVCCNRIRQAIRPPLRSLGKIDAEAAELRGSVMREGPAVSSNARRRGKLLTVLGLAFGVSVTVGGTIGVGILAQPGTIARELPDPRWFLAAWLVGGLYALLGANSVAELAAMTPRSGAYYVYV